MRTFSKASLSILLATAAFIFSTMQLDAQVGKNLVINRFVSDPDNIETHVVVSDVDGVGPNLKFRFSTRKAGSCTSATKP